MSKHILIGMSIIILIGFLYIILQAYPINLDPIQTPEYAKRELIHALEYVNYPTSYSVYYTNNSGKHFYHFANLTMNIRYEGVVFFYGVYGTTAGPARPYKVTCYQHFDAYNDIDECFCETYYYQDFQNHNAGETLSGICTDKKELSELYTMSNLVSVIQDNFPELVNITMDGNCYLGDRVIEDGYNNETYCFEYGALDEYHSKTMIYGLVTEVDWKVI